MPSLELTRATEIRVRSSTEWPIYSIPSWLSPIWPKLFAVTLRNEVISLVNTSIACQRENALFRKQVVEFEATQLEIEPGAVGDVIEAHKDLLKVKSAGIIGRRKQIEGDVLLQRSTGVEVEAAQVKAGAGDALDRLPVGWGLRAGVIVSIGTLPTLTRCQIGVMRKTTGQ